MTTSDHVCSHACEGSRQPERTRWRLVSLPDIVGAQVLHRTHLVYIHFRSLSRPSLLLEFPFPSLLLLRKLQVCPMNLMQKPE